MLLILKCGFDVFFFLGGAGGVCQRMKAQYYCFCFFPVDVIKPTQSLRGLCLGGIATF